MTSSELFPQKLQLQKRNYHGVLTFLNPPPRGFIPHFSESPIVPQSISPPGDARPMYFIEKTLCHEMG